MWNIPFNGLAVTAGCVSTARIMGDPEVRQNALARGGGLAGWGRDKRYTSVLTRAMGHPLGKALQSVESVTPLFLREPWDTSLGKL